MTDTTADSDRLAKLQAVATELTKEGGPVDRDLFDAVVPDWQFVEYRADGTGPGRYFLRQSTGAVAVVDDPLATTDGAIWLAGQTLSDRWEPPELTPPWHGEEARCFLRPRDGSWVRAVATSGTSLPIALCLAVVWALIEVLDPDGSAA